MNSNPYYAYKDQNHNEMGLYEDDFANQNASIQKQIRLNFIRKVLGILGAQLFFTVLFCIFSMTNKAFLEFQRRNIALFFICLVGSIVIMVLLFCFDYLVRKVPNNYIMLGLFTFFESYMVSFICGVSNPSTVLMAAVMTFSMVIALGLYAFNTKTDFTLQGGALFVFGCGFMMLTMFGLFTNNKFFHIFLCVIGIILFGFYLIYDIQLIVGNKTVSLDTDEYIIGALILYTDIISLFLKILELLNLTGNNN
jgi:hypothetical protein